MDFAQYQYSIGGFKAIEMYPFTRMTKRYFHGFRENVPEQLYRIVVYPHKLVKVEPLIASIKSLKDIEHGTLGKIAHLYEETTLTKTGQKPEHETVIAVVFEENPPQSYINLFDFVVQMTNLSEMLVRDITHNLVEFVEFMEKKGFVGCFNSNDVLFERVSGRVRVDDYGDWRFFVVGEELGPDVWEVGSLLFTLLKGNPPYNKRSLSDPHYSCLNKGQFQKFWGIVSEKPIKNPSENATNFLNLCFKKQTRIQDLKHNPWLLSYSPLTQQQRTQEIANIIAAKQQKLNQKTTQQRERKQKMAQAARERACLLSKRGTNQLQIQSFLDYLLSQQEKIRPIDKHLHSQDHKQKIKVQIAHFLTLLTLNERKGIRIYDIKDHKHSITFRIKTELGQSVNVDSEVELVLDRLEDNKVEFKCQKIQGSFFQTLWVNNYIKELCSQI